MSIAEKNITSDIERVFPGAVIAREITADGIPTLWVEKDRVHKVLEYAKYGEGAQYKMLFDLTAIDERARKQRGLLSPARDFALVYHLLDIENDSDLRIKVPLSGEYPDTATITDIWPAANWYEREVWDMFGIGFSGHPNMRRILNPDYWQGHPLRKEHPARATELEGYSLSPEEQVQEEDRMRFYPEEFGLSRGEEDTEFMFLNLGPHHPGTHGLLRIVLQLEGEAIKDSVVEIGFHHRGAEKMAERQTFHTFIPYTDRIDYLAGVQNNLPYCMSVEKLCGIDIPLRAQFIRVMMCELYRIANHLVWFGTFCADIGAMSPVFYTFSDRERIFDITEAICGGRMHPSWFRIGGVQADLPEGWREMVDDFVRYFPGQIDEYEKAMVENSIFGARTKGIGYYTKESAIEWGVTGPNLRSTGVDWDLRKKRPYSAYDQFDFEVPLADEGDSYARSIVRIREMRESLKIIEQAASNMPSGHYKSDHPLAMPPSKERTMHDIETLINHFLTVSWGQPVPAQEAIVPTETPKGMTGYYVTSDGGNSPYRCRIRTPSFPHMQTLPEISRGYLVADLLSMLGSIDFVLADVDR